MHCSHKVQTAKAVQVVIVVVVVVVVIFTVIIMLSSGRLFASGSWHECWWIPVSLAEMCVTCTTTRSPSRAQI